MKKRLSLLALLAIAFGSDLFANFFTQNAGCCSNPPPAYNRAGCCENPRCCRARVKGKPRWACCCKPRSWSLRRWLFGEDRCKTQRSKKCCWPNAEKTCTPCRPTLEQPKPACCTSQKMPVEYTQTTCCETPVECTQTTCCETVECAQPCSYKTIYEDVEQDKVYEDGYEEEVSEESETYEELD